jgi:glycosyltransferase involved in cell wall biosynthesis
MSKTRILTVISNYNEEKLIERCINDFKRNSTIISDLLVIDNASTDRSVELILSNNTDCLCHPINTGGSAGVIKTALLYSFLNDYDIYCHLDGDCQHNADELATLIQPIIDKKANIVVGSRFLFKEGFQSFFLRRLGIFAYSYVVSRIAGQKITDLTSGFRAYDKKAIRFFAKQYQHELDPCIQMLLIASFAGLILKEVPVRMNPRCAGRSEIGIIQALKFSILGAIHIIGIILQKKTYGGKDAAKC